jgi:FMN phosphatase YigB (HAD superfamily)
MGLWPQVEIIEGTVEALSILHGRIPLAIATNASVSSRPMIELALRRAGLHLYFEQIYCFTELGYRKDQPEFWRAVQHGLGVPLKHVAMVGDSYDQDALFPRQFGVQGVWFNLHGADKRLKVATPMVTELPCFSRWVADSAEQGQAPAFTRREND